MAFNVGDTVGDYQILSVLGTGGMGKVYKARNVISDRVEALKVLLPDLANETELADRFMREIKLLASLNHPNIAALHTALRLDNQLLMVMEYVEGRTIEDRLKDGPLPPGEAAGYISQALSALAFAHERGVVHRDIKPANMMIAAGGQLKLMDFGIAKAVADRRLTMTGTTLGSLFYMSPEQVKGISDLDGRSDIYSVGVALYEMVTGTRPFKGGSDYSIMVAHLEQAPIPPIQIDPSLPPVLNEIIMTAIQKDRENRFQSANAFRSALESAAPSLGQSMPAPMPVAASRPAATPLAPPPLAPPPVPSMTQAVTQGWMQPQQPQTPPPLPPPLAPPPPPPFVPTPAPVAWAPPPAAAVAPPQRGGHRGLWMALGGLTVLAVLVLAAIQGPKLYRTWAGGPAAQSAAPAETPAPQAAEPTPAPVPVATPEATPAASATPVAAAPAPVTPVIATPRVARPATRVARPESAPAVQSAPPEQPAQVESPAAPPQPSAPVVDNARLEQLRDRLGMLAPRANAIRAGLQNLERRQQESGYGLRGDISAAWKRMEYLLDEAQAEINANHPARAQRNLDLAEREAEKLDRFLGR
jgi:serine/threonine-protein kinase